MSAAEIFEYELPAKMDWRELAACKGQTRLFFGKKAERPQARDRREAKAARLCTMCLVQKQCRQFARDNREYGFWGGESEEDRYVAGYPVTAAIGVRTRMAEELVSHESTRQAGPTGAGALGGQWLPDQTEMKGLRA